MSEKRNGIVLDGMELAVARDLVYMLLDGGEGRDGWGVEITWDDSVLVDKLVDLGGTTLKGIKDVLYETYMEEWDDLVNGDLAFSATYDILYALAAECDWQGIARWLAPFDDDGNLISAVTAGEMMEWFIDNGHTDATMADCVFLAKDHTLTFSDLPEVDLAAVKEARMKLMDNDPVQKSRAYVDMMDCAASMLRDVADGNDLDDLNDRYLAERQADGCNYHDLKDSDWWMVVLDKAERLARTLLRVAEDAFRADALDSATNAYIAFMESDADMRFVSLNRGQINEMTLEAMRNGTVGIPFPTLSELAVKAMNVDMMVLRRMVELESRKSA